MKKRVHLQSIKTYIRTWSITVFAVALWFFATSTLDLDIVTFVGRLSNAGKVLGRMMVLDFSTIGNIFFELLTSLGIAIASLFLGLLTAAVLSFLAAENIAPSRFLALFIKGGIAMMRAVPGLVWILMVVASLGFSNTAGTVGMIISTVGYLTKSFVVSIEDLGIHAIEALRATGANWFQIVGKGLLPQLVRPFLSWISIRLETSIAESINLGMLGVAGIGLLLIKAVHSYDYGKISAIVLVIFLTMLLTEFGVNQLKKRIQ